MYKKSGFLNISFGSCIKKLFFYTCALILASAVWSRSTVSSTVVENSHILKNAAGTIYSLVCINASGAPGQYIQLFNSATVPADTAVPILTPMWCPAGPTNCSYDLGTTNGVSVSAGLAWSNSSTLGTKTIGSANTWCTGVVQ